VIADLVDVTRSATVDPYSRVPHLAFQPSELADLTILPMEEIRTAYYLRVHVQDQLGVMAELCRILAEAGISIDAVLQKEPGETARTDIVIITHQTREKYVNAAIAKIEQLSTVVSKVVRIRLESLS
jgi:homoserine dehydrogenase